MPTARDDALDAVAAVARDAGLWRMVADTHDAVERLRSGLFYVVCVGQFKRGKSALLNGLVEEAVLPTGVVPITSAVTILRHGARLSARVRFRDRDWEECDPRALATYVSEEHNPGNEKGVRAVEVLVLSWLLASGLCLVDTPGLGSVIVANTEATRDFVPHVDAALVVLGADPPITGEELALVQILAGSVRDFIVVFNKADRQPEDERAAARDFTARVLAPVLGHRPEPILQVSATDHLSGRGPARDWGPS